MSFAALKHLSSTPKSHPRLRSLRLSTHRIKTVLIYGDSNTWGFNPDYCKSDQKALQRFSHEKRWTTLCQTYLGASFQLVAEGLNSRTTGFEDCDPEGEYTCNGRTTLPPILHTHKPLDLVILALSANDFKQRYSATVHDINRNVRILVKDVHRHTNLGAEPIHQTEPGTCSIARGMEQLIKPKIMVIGPPIMHATPVNRVWGFPEDVQKHSRRLSAILALTCKDLEVPYLPLGALVPVSATDGVHYSEQHQPMIARLVADKIVNILDPHHKPTHA